MIDIQHTTQHQNIIFTGLSIVKGLHPSPGHIMTLKGNAVSISTHATHIVKSSIQSMFITLFPLLFNKPFLLYLYIRPTEKGVCMSSINPSIRLGISLRTGPIGGLKADTQPYTRVDTQQSASFEVGHIFIISLHTFIAEQYTKV